MTNETTTAYTTGSLAAALETMKPSIETSFKSVVAGAWRRLSSIPKYATDPYAAGSDWTNYQSLNACKFALKGTRAEGAPVFAHPTIWTLDEARIEVEAAKYATEACQEWRSKFEAKVGQLENATLVYGSGAWLRIAGTRNGRRVEINQQMILNVSNKGKVFNQFPARIKVDGKAISEASFKKAI